MDTISYSKAKKLQSQVADIDHYSRLIFGQEYLSAFHKKIMSGYGVTYGQNINVVFSGDSTTAGDSTTTPYNLNNLFKSTAGVNGIFAVNSVNNGHSGKATFDWDSTYFQNDLDANPDLLVLRWGVNDPYFGKNKTNFEASLRSGLTKIRASRPQESLSIILMSPNSTSADPTGRNEIWDESVLPIIRKAARDFQCCVIDTYSYLKDSRHASDYMDSPYSDYQHIHPNNVMNLWIMNLIFEVAIPKTLRDKFGASNIDNSTHLDVLKLSTDLPTTYPKGISMYRTSAISGDFIDGVVYTFHQSENTLLQINTDYHSASAPNIKMRIGQSGSTNTWGAWQTVQGVIGTIENWTNILDASLSNGWLNYGGGYENLGYYKDGISGRVYLKGLIKSGTMTKGTLITTLPSGYTPSKTQFIPVMTNTTIGAIKIEINGQITTWNLNDNVFVSFDNISFRI